MLKITTFMLLLLTQVVHSKPAVNDTLTFPSSAQRTEIATKLFLAIESIDAVTIALRNNTRKVDWQTYKAMMIENITSASDWNSLYRAIDNLHYGILNRHSYLIPSDSIKNRVTNYPRWPGVEIGYTWPKVTFFSLKNQKSIASLNGRNIEEIFEEFFNLYCNDVHRSGCLGLFTNYIKSGYIFLGDTSPLVVTYIDGSTDSLLPTESKRSSPKTAFNCELLYPSLNLELVYDGNQSCLYQSTSSYVLKILYFGNWGTSHDDIYCQHSNNSGMCSEINQIKKITRNSPAKHLIIDLQDNGGGSENTPWIAALTKNGFQDNLVRYRNIPHLSDSKTRNGAFYGSERAENWYQKIISQSDNLDRFLPVRGDFCRGSLVCGNDTIPSSTTPIKYKDLKLVINRGCVSSCDDFIWRTRQYANAKTYGQLPATDGAYARLSGYLFIDQQGQINNIITAEDTLPSGEHGTLLVSYKIPITKTVDANGNTLEDNSRVLDHPLTIEKHNYQQLTLANLARVLNL